ncbi:MAG: hypothetical protein Q4C01_00995 [Clostridia bacterium]|nr:hypothetical protein [Clostridia bacterium]
MKLSKTTANRIGLDTVLDRLEPQSPYGRRAKKNLHPLEKAELFCAFDDLRAMMTAIKNEPAAFLQLESELAHFFEARSSVNNVLKTAASDVDFFELKRYLLSWNALSKKLQTLNPLKGLFTRELGGALKILDPEGMGIVTFVIDSQELREVRRKKACAGAEERSEYAEKEERLEREQRARLCKDLQPHCGDILKSMAALERFDLTLAKAMLAIRDGAVIPEFNDSEGIELVGMTNPRVGEELERSNRSFCPITLSAVRGCTVITGANMGGKSVALMTLALNVCLAHMGIAVYAERAVLPYIDELCYIGADGAAQESGLSSFAMEVRSWNEALRLAQDSELSLLIFDEPARGTNPHEGAAIARGLCRYGERLRSITVIATHYDGVSEHADASYRIAGLKPVDAEQIRAYGAQTIAENMDYSLICESRGAEVPRDAMRICELMGMPKELIDLIKDGEDSTIS